MDIPIYDNDGNSSGDEVIGGIDTDNTIECNKHLQEEVHMDDWNLSDSIYEDNSIPPGDSSPRSKIEGTISLAHQSDNLWGEPKRQRLQVNEEKIHHIMNKHVNEIYNPFLNNISRSLDLINPNCVYLDTNDSNLVFACELPSVTNNVTTGSSGTKKETNTKRIIRTRAIVNPPYHSKIASDFVLIPGFLTREETIRFHRPSFPDREISMDCSWVEQTNKPKEDYFIKAIRSLSDLSSVKNHLILIEYSEPQPPVFSNQGMSSLIINWINPEGPEEETYETPAEGVNRILTEKEKMPLMGTLQKGSQMLTLCNSLYNTPLIEHDIPYTDYLLIVKIENPREQTSLHHTYSASIRKVDRLFVAGKMEPNSRVYQPNDEDFFETQDNLESYLLQRAFDKMSRITFEQMCRIFPNLRNESEHREFDERHKHFFQVSNHIYTLRNAPLPISVPRKLTPESVCLMQSSYVSYQKLLKSGIRNILGFTSTQGTSYLRCREDLSLIREKVNKKIETINQHIASNKADEISPDEHCSYGALKNSYEKILPIIEKECKATEFFIERIYRTTWNLTDHYISCIIESKGRLQMNESNYFDKSIMFKDAFGEDYIFFPSRVLRSRKGAPNNATKKATHRDPNDDTDSNEEITNEENEERPANTKKPDLRKLCMGKLKFYAKKVGATDAEIESLPRWGLVNLVSKNSMYLEPELYREKKKNQQELNVAFQTQLDVLFNTQIESLKHAPEIIDKKVVENIFTRNSLINHVEPLEPLISMDRESKDMSLSTDYMNSNRNQYNNQFNYYHNNGSSSMRNAARSGQPLVGPNGRPIIVRRIRFIVEKTKVCVDVTNRRLAKEIHSTQEAERKFSEKNVPLSDCSYAIWTVIFDVNAPNMRKVPDLTRHRPPKTNGNKKRPKNKHQKKQVVTPIDDTPSLNNRQMQCTLNKLMKKLEALDHCGNFKELPMRNVDWADNYRKAITNIVDFNTIKERISQYGYNQHTMLEDLKLLYANTEKFNTEKHPLTQLAGEFVKTAEQFIEDNKKVFATIEQELQ